MFSKIYTYFSSSTLQNFYIILLWAQIADLFHTLIVVQMVKDGLLAFPVDLSTFFSFVFAITINLFELILFRKFVQGNVAFVAYTSLVFLSIVILFIAVGPFANNLHPMVLKNFLSLGIGFQAVSVAILLVLMMKDIFMKKHNLSYSLVGATSVFILIGTFFAIIYSLMEATFPGMFKGNDPLDPLNICYEYSYFVISGQDPPTEVHILIRKISIFESIFSNLFAIMIVGRLLTKDNF